VASRGGYSPGRHSDRARSLSGPPPNRKDDRPDKSETAAEGKPSFQWKTISQGAVTSVWAAVFASADEIGAIVRTVMSPTS
jgi:hypothetical protein